MKSAPHRLILGLGFSVLSDFSSSTAFGAATTGSGTDVRVLAAVGASAETVAAAPKEKVGPELFSTGATVGTVLMMGAHRRPFAEGVLDRDNLLVQISRTKLDRIDLAVIFRAEVILWHIVIITSEGVGRKLVCCSGRNKWRRRFAIGLPRRKTSGATPYW